MQPLTRTSALTSRVLAALIAIVALFAAGHRAAVGEGTAIPRYKVTEIGLIAFDLSNAFTRFICVNDKGQVAGNWMPQPGVLHGYVWENGRRIDLGCLKGYVNARALAINNAGVIVGYCDGLVNGGRGMRAFLWKNGKMRDLGSPQSAALDEAVDINDKNEVLVETAKDTYLWQNGKYTNLSVDGAMALNDIGEIAGTGVYHRGAALGYAYLQSPHGRKDLGTLAGGYRSTATCINNEGQVVGYAGVNHRSRGFLWSGGRLIDLGTEADSDDSVALSINNTGQIVGYAGGPGVFGVDSRAYLWQGGKGYNLNSLIAPGNGWLLVSADAISDNGYIVGYGHYNGTERAYLLTPVE